MQRLSELSLERKIPLATSLVLALALGLYTFIAFRAVAKSSEAVAQSHIHALAQELARTTTNSAALRAKQVYAVANLPAGRHAVTKHDFAAIDTLLDDLVLPTDSTLDVTFFDSQRRRLFVHGSEPDIEIYSELTPLFDAAGRSKDAAVNSNFFPYENRGHLWSMTAIREGDTIAGYMAQLRQIRTSREVRRTIDALIGPGNDIYFTDKDGRDREWVGIDGTLYPADSTRDLVAVAPIANNPYAIVVATPRAAIIKPAWQFLARTGIFAFLLLLLGTVIAWLSSRRYTRLLVRLTEERQANQTKSEFLANVSHEIRTPINAMIGYADLLEAGVTGPINQGQTEQLQRIKTSGAHLIGLVDDLLDFARIESGRITITSEHALAEKSIRTALTVVEPQAQEKSIVIETKCDKGVRYVGDPKRVEQILVNLLGNAVKFTDNGGNIVLSCRIGTPGLIEFSVSDNGIGVPPDRLEAIFEPFVQVHGGYTRRHGGAGLGLAISRKLAEQMRGSLTAKSELGKGSTFTLTLPA